jgi:tRNA nucleotidyltransferase (CCA-adding enzyme)
VFGNEREAVHRLLNTLEWRSGRRAALRPSEIYELFRDLSVEALLYAMARTASEEIRRIISHFITHLRQVSCLLGGNDLRKLGLAPGPVYKEVFRALLAARLDGQVVSREDEVALVRDCFLTPSPPLADGR